MKKLFSVLLTLSSLITRAQEAKEMGFQWEFQTAKGCFIKKDWYCAYTHYSQAIKRLPEGRPEVAAECYTLGLIAAYNYGDGSHGSRWQYYKKIRENNLPYDTTLIKMALISSYRSGYLPVSDSSLILSSADELIKGSNVWVGFKALLYQQFLASNGLPDTLFDHYEKLSRSLLIAYSEKYAPEQWQALTPVREKDWRIK